MSRDELRQAIAAGDVVRALPMALEAWRAQRSVAWAELVDALSARCARLAPPRGGRHLQGWWMTHAAGYDATVVATLIDDADHNADRSEGEAEGASELHRAMQIAGVPHVRPSQRNRIDRTAAMIAWPPDPRVTAVLARWFVACSLQGTPSVDGVVVAYLEVVAQHLVELGDTRAIAPLRTALHEPRGRTPGIRAAQARLAEGVIAALERSAGARASDDAEIAQWLDRLGDRPRGREADERALWDEITRAPRDVGPRLVLADYLQLRGDPRGELIALQCAETPQADARARTLLAQHRDRWLGDLALVLKPTSCVFRRGMLEEAVVGRSSTPDWAYAKVRGHRELATLHTVAPSHTIAPHRYLDLIEQLGHPLSRVALTWPLLEALSRRAPLTSVAAVSFQAAAPSLAAPAAPPLEAQLRALADAVPTLEELWLSPAHHAADAPDQPLDAALRAFHARMPALRRAVIVTSARSWDTRLSPDQRAQLAALPWIELAFAP